MHTKIEDYWSPAPLLELFDQYAGKFIDLDRDVQVDGDQLRSRRDQLVRLLQEASLRPGDRVVFSLGNGPGFVATLMAILEIGAAPLLTHVDTPPPELLRHAQACGARWIASEKWSAAQMSDVAVSACPIDADSWCEFTWSTVDESNKNFAGDFPGVGGVPLNMTSGTTGRPKLAMRHAEAAVAEARNYIDAMQIGANEQFFCTVPMSHGYGFGTCLAVPLLSGASVVSTRVFNPRLALRALSDHAITTFSAVPAMLDLLLAAAPAGYSHLPKRVFSAGAPLSERTSSHFMKRTGKVARPLYGTTETGGISLVGELDSPCLESCVGLPMRGMRAEIRRDPEAPEIDERFGRVYIHSDAAMVGYLTKTGVDTSALDDGWFNTGDIGYLDEQGSIHLVGRESDVINVFGMKVIPSEVEKVISEFPGISDVKVYAGKHRSGSEIVKAAVAGVDAEDVESLKKHCETQLAPYKVPGRIICLESLPRTGLGKIIKAELP
ncbi:Long-chain-fatty-acid--CoA ligase [Rosistilla carotiformis]|uniref:Long-chain-fatty-acid--CoA ligase n=1 Tax=Rosistilla carotiformis TaxID=2528017 RepID=A0A518JWV3_9BACT|nr:class I adenylate-forming enzyme family protein [Rosistilla carotiformis]QDV70027.1 Long-chain-fatty-acid--CoA ligase [Rosistilla carotiformis]